eukprot:snap_masked-scaffold_22-processed-gene-0.16-mRNA-1 protein AED:1.00 eAED:1.00 QI:0/0/0/0/1/1/2/0/136
MEAEGLPKFFHWILSTSLITILDLLRSSILAWTVISKPSSTKSTFTSLVKHKDRSATERPKRRRTTMASQMSYSAMNFETTGGSRLGKIGLSLYLSSLALPLASLLIKVGTGWSSVSSSSQLELSLGEHSSRSACS